MLLGAAISTTVQARHLTPDEALTRAVNQSTSNANGGIKMAPAMTAESKLVYSAEVDNLPMAYVFANAANQGFMIVSADDVASPVLGYSDNSVIDPNNMPSNLKAWLDGYAREIAYAAQHPSFNNTPASATATPDHAAVAPKLTTTWDQDAPYWNACPTLNGSRCYTGCVATAMAQIMNYHQWPEKGQGSISYDWNYSTQKLTCDFSTITFEWDKMLDNYTSSSPADNCNAVAQLMMACGYASKMQYTPYASGTTGYSATTGMIEYMNYDKSLAIQDRSWYSSEEWDNLVYTELTTNGPVYYDGTGSDGGHAFVCDGYRGNGYYHFNWGWGGLSDGYFLLNALNPGSQGAGGNTTGFNYSQSIMQNLSKPKAGSTVTAIIASVGGFTTTTTSTTKGRMVTFTTAVTGMGYGFFSFSTQTISNVSIGVKYVNTATQAVGYMTSIAINNVSLSPLTGFSKIEYVTIPNTLTDGSYIISPVYKVGSGEWTDIKNEGSYNNAMTMTVNGSTVTFANVGAEAKIEASNIKLNSSITAATGFNISLTLTNSGTREFNGQIEARLLNASGSTVDYGESYATILEPGESMNVTYVSELVKGTLNAGTYSLRFYSPTSNQYLNEPISITVFEEPQMTCSKFVIGNQNAINCNDVRARATVTCSTLGYTGPIAFIAYHVDDLSTPVGMFQTDPITFTAGESKSVTVAGIFQEGKVGESYIGTMAFRGQDGHYNQIGTATVRFRVSTASGIDDVTADRSSDAAVIYPNPAESMATLEAPAAISAVEVYSLSGAMMKVNADIDGNRASLDVSALTSGTYIVIASCADGSRMPVKLIKR